MNLIQQLMHGTVYEGLPVPPNRLMIQAAAALGQLESVNLINHNLIQQLQLSEAQNLEIITEIRKQLEEANKEIEQLKVQQKELYGTIYDYESLRNGEREASALGSGDTRLTGSDSSSEGYEGSTSEVEAPSISNKSEYFAGSVNETNS